MNIFWPFDVAVALLIAVVCNRRVDPSSAGDAERSATTARRWRSSAGTFFCASEPWRSTVP
jgi:hypothetical protein